MKGGSIVFVQVSAGTVDQAIREIKRDKSVTSADPVMGPHDIVVTGAFKNLDSLRKFTEHLDNQEFCKDCVALPTYGRWEREGRKEQPWTAWTLVKTQNVEATKSELKRIGAVNEYYETAGEFDLIARLSTQNPEELHEAILQEMQKVEGVQRTETFPTIPTE